MGAEVTFFRRMIFRIDEDRVVGTGGHAGLAPDADRFVKIDDPVRALEHRGSRTGRDAGRMRALIAARYLMRASRLGKHAHVDVLHIGTSDADRNYILGLAGGGTRVTADAARVIDDLGPAELRRWLGHGEFGLGKRKNYITQSAPLGCETGIKRGERAQSSRRSQAIKAQSITSPSQSGTQGW